MKGWESNPENLSGGDVGEARNIGSREVEARLFCISINVCSFKATQHLPMRSVNLFVRIVLPEIVRAVVEASDLPSKITASLRTHPPVLVERGTEINIPNGYAHSRSYLLNFPAFSPSRPSYILLFSSLCKFECVACRLEVFRCNGVQGFGPLQVITM